MDSLLTQPAAPEVSSGWVALVTLLSVIATSLFQMYRENRNHRWEEQRRTQRAQELATRVSQEAADVRRQVEQEAAEVRSQVEQRAVDLAARVTHEAADVRSRVEQEAAQVRSQVDQRAAQVGLEARAELHNVHRAIEDNTSITKRVEAVNTQALNAANSFNAKLHSALEQLDVARDDTKASEAKRAEHIEQVVVDNNQQIRQTRDDLSARGKE
ncbi:MAG TPA: hypothetical protein VNM48_19155 [Chloroflexota bacterium]|nr:hypothetical protein [Chloroflexota bacterium]